MKSQAEQTLFTGVAVHRAADVQKWRDLDRSALVNPDTSRLLDNNQPPAAVTGVNDSNRLAQPGRDFLEGKKVKILCGCRLSE